jgi:sialate O-acetylesterase
VVSASSTGKIGPNGYPSLLYNGMIKPLVPFAIRGVLWYQGESNASRAAQYKHAFPLLIKDWRSAWNRPDMPFYFVQLASWIANNGNSAKGSTWAELREAQADALKLPNTGMAVALDLGDTKDIHPPNKKDVGLRLAAIALNKLYDVQTEYSGPVYQSMKITGNNVLISFQHAGPQLKVNDKYGYLKGFEVAGSDRKFYYAKADVKNNQVIVYSDSVAAPVAVRYGWADDMPEANLYNDAGFPAVPFRTDNWPGITLGERYSVK